jgi:hypothetical protein
MPDDNYIELVALSLYLLVLLGIGVRSALFISIPLTARWSLGRLFQPRDSIYHMQNSE